MRRLCIMENWIFYREAADPQRAAASLISTRTCELPGKTAFPILSQQRNRHTKNAVFYGLLLQKHYFRLRLAKDITANVIRTESTIIRFLTCPEVAL